MDRLIQLKLGTFITSILLTNLHILIVISLMVIGHFSTMEIFKTIFDVLAITYVIVFPIAHIKASIGLMNESYSPTFSHPSLEEPKSMKEALITKNPVVVGFVWRVMLEWKCLKEILVLNFRYK